MKPPALTPEQVQPLVNALQFAVDWARGRDWRKDPLRVLDDALAHARNLGLTHKPGIAPPTS